MTVAPAIVYAVVTALTIAIGALWAVMLADHRNCQKNLAQSNHAIKLLTEHTIAQQHDIRAFVDDRRGRGLRPMPLQSEKTVFYRQHIEKEEEGGDLGT